MNSQHQKYEGWLYGLAFLLALGLRLLQLGALPLNDSEANIALQALHLTQGLKPALSPHLAYILLTSLIFFINGGGTNFLARLIPALAGSFLIFVPLLFRDRFKSSAPIILAFFLALDPGLLALSRQASSAILAVAFLLFAWGFWYLKKPNPAGVFGGLSLLSGPSIWAGLLGLGIAWALQQFVESKKKSLEEAEAESEHVKELFPLSVFLLSLLASLILFGTFFFLAPAGLSAALSSILAYLRGWVQQPSDLPNTRLLASLLVYQPLAVFLALINLLRAWWQGRRRTIRLSIWMLVALLLALFYPGHQFADLIWAIIPLLVLASMELARHLEIFPEERAEVRGVVALTIFIIVFAWLDLASVSWTPIPSDQGNLRIWLFLGAIVLLMLSYVLVAAGWSIRTAKLGAIWGLTISLGILTLASGIGAEGLRGTSTPEFWMPEPRPAQADLLLSTINDLSDWGSGDRNALPVVIHGMNSAALEWLLREHQVAVEDALDPASSPAFVITPVQGSLALPASYRGQDFSWNERPSWDTALFNDWVRWLTLRQMPATSEKIIVWARVDLFLESSQLTAP